MFQLTCVSYRHGD